MPMSKDTQTLMEAQDENETVTKKKQETEKPKTSPEEFVKASLIPENGVRISIKKITDHSFRVNYMRAELSNVGMQFKDWRIFKSFFLVVVTDDDGSMKIVDKTLGK